MFHAHFPDVAERETRTVIVLNRPPLPGGKYAFLEMFCDERDCDCRRVFFSVASEERRQIEAVINYGWEDAAFYERWLRMSEPEDIQELMGPSLNLTSPQADTAPALLDLFRDTLLKDEAYIERVKRHYFLFRSRVNGSVSPPTRRAMKTKRRNRST
jgi:hypothetical protein